MATTTNFGWETPDDTDLVKDGAAAIRTALGGVDSSFVDLKGGTTGQVLAKASNADLDFVWSADAAGMTNPMTTTGDIIFSSSGSTPARRAIGTTGQILTVSGGVPVWASPAGGGKVLQVVEGTTSTTTSIASGTYTDTGITATITPSATTSRVMVIVSAPISLIRDSSTNFAGMRLVRNSTNLTTNDYAVGFTNTGSTSFEVNHTLSFNFVDSPSSTSALTYKIQGNVLFTANTGTVRYNYPNTRSSIILVEIGA